LSLKYNVNETGFPDTKILGKFGGIIMWKQKGLVICLVGILFVAGLWRNQRAWEADALVSPEGKKIALTFDDGPHSKYTEELLDGLKERGVKVSFFVLGSRVVSNRELVQRMAEEGHLIGSHTYSHVELTQYELTEAVCEIEQACEVLKEVTGQEIEYVRPPYGSWSEALTDATSLTMVKWTIDTLDWKYKDADRIVSQVLKEAQDGSIILMHDRYASSVDAALRIVDALQKEGYEFVTVDELYVD